MCSNVLNNSKLLVGLAFISFFFSCCDKDEPEESPNYRWKIETRVFTGIDPVYAANSYFIFPTNYQTGEMDLLRVEEKNGDTIYNLQLLSLDDNLSNSNAKAYAQDDELHILMDRNFYKIDIETGQIKQKFDFPNFFWRSNISERYVYTASFAALDSFYFAYFDKDSGSQEIIHGEKLSNGLTSIGGRQPIVNGDGFLLPFYEGVIGDVDNYIIEYSPTQLNKIKIPFEANSLGGPIFEDVDNLYIYAIDFMFAYNKENLTLLWELETVPNGGGPYAQTKDKIYMVPSRCIESCQANIMYIIDKITGEYEVVDSPASYGPMKIDGNFIHYVGGGDFMKFDMINEKFISAPEEENSRTAYQPVWGKGENSKILFDDDGWHCFPL